MYTIWELLKNISHSSPEGFAGVLGIFIFLIGIIGAGVFRVKEMIEQEDSH